MPIALRILWFISNTETGKKVIKITIGIVLGFILLILTAFHWIMTSPLEALGALGETSFDIFGVVLEQYGYRYGTVDSVNFGDFENTEATDPEQFKKLMSEATKYIGRPYVWGGSTPRTGFDCSGFVCWSFTQTKTYNLPRTTAQGIFDQCIALPREEAKPGDLIFFHSTYNSVGAVSHIGIYAGKDKNGADIMLHCGDPIGYAKIDLPYWQKHFYAFGRLDLGVSPQTP